MEKKADIKKIKKINKENDKDYDLIITIVNRGFSDYVVSAAHDAGASGSTMLLARGTGIHETEEVLGIKISPEKEIILTLVLRKNRSAMMKHICEQSNLNHEGKGICFSLPVNQIAGISHLLKQKKA